MWIQLKENSLITPLSIHFPEILKEENYETVYILTDYQQNFQTLAIICFLIKVIIKKNSYYDFYILMSFFVISGQSCSAYSCWIFSNMSTRKTVFHRDIQAPRRELKIRLAEHSMFGEIWNAWMADETLSRVFDIFSRSKQNWKKRSK